MSRRFWQEGPGLALLLLGFLAVVGLVLWGAAKGPEPLNYICFILFGIGFVKYAWVAAEVAAESPIGSVLAWPMRIVGLVGGIWMAIEGVVRLVQG